MLIGILQTGQPPPEMESRVGSYPAMIHGALGPQYSYRQFDVTSGELPDRESAADAYVITGSASSVYDAQSWISGLREWLGRADPAAPLVGICFGHQIMAEAYGGKVRAAQGMAVGLQQYEVSGRETWMDDARSFVIPAFNRDQVISAPAAAQVTATSDTCPIAALSYMQRRAVSFQGHPEFTLEFTGLAVDRMEQRGLIDAAHAERARASLRRPHDCARVLAWIRSFLSQR